MKRERLELELAEGHFEVLPELVRELKRHNDVARIAQLFADRIDPLMQAFAPLTTAVEAEPKALKSALQEELGHVRRTLIAGFDHGLFTRRILGWGGHAVAVEALSDDLGWVAWKIPMGLTGVLGQVTPIRRAGLPLPAQMHGGMTLTPYMGGLHRSDASQFLKKVVVWQQALPADLPLARALGSRKIEGHHTALYELLQGPPLRSALPLTSDGVLGHSDFADNHGSAPAWTALAQLTEAVLALHEFGVRHGDLKPEHVFLESGTCRLLDPLPTPLAPRYQQDPGSTWLGSPGYALHAQSAALRDLQGLAAIGIELFGIEPGWREAFFSARPVGTTVSFVHYVSTAEERYDRHIAVIERLPGHFADWVIDVLHASDILPFFPRRPSNPEPLWCKAMLERLLSLANAGGIISDAQAREQVGWEVPDPEIHAVRLPHPQTESDNTIRVAQSQDFWSRIKRRLKKRRP